MLKQIFFFVILFFYNAALYSQRANPFNIYTPEDQLDVILKYCAHRTWVNDNGSIPLNRDEYLKVRDSLISNKAIFQETLRSYFYRENGGYGFLSHDWDSLPAGFDESLIDKSYYYAERTSIPDIDNRIIVNIGRIMIEKHDTPFPEDSIGHFNRKTDFTKVDKYVKSIGFLPPKILAAKLTSPFPSDLEKVRAIFVWIASNISYDYEGLYSQNPNNYTCKVEDVLRKKVAVCSGYAALFYLLCKNAKINCRVIEGNVSGKQLHAWNAVEIDAKWYLLDVTWASCLKNYYFYYSYFLTSPEYFVFEHYSAPPLEKWNLLKYPPTLKEFNAAGRRGLPWGM